MPSYATDFIIIDTDMHLSELHEEATDRVFEMARKEGYTPSAASSWEVVEFSDGCHLLGVTPVEPIPLSKLVA